jgi:hypothetical protein
MEKKLIVIHNATTGKIIEREMNNEELAQLAKDKEDNAKRKADEAAKVAQKVALLDRLGITADEAKLLLA